jgi:hypothetical protein
LATEEVELCAMLDSGEFASNAYLVGLKVWFLSFFDDNVLWFIYVETFEHGCLLANVKMVRWASRVVFFACEALLSIILGGF